MNRLASAVTIQTLDGIRFALPLAGPVRRSLALLIDLLAIVTAATLVINLSRIVFFVSKDATEALGLISYFVLSISYGIVLEWKWRGQTLGKRVMGIRVLDAGGLKLQFSQIAIRNLMRSVDCLPFAYLMGGASMLLTRHYQRLGDIVANTIVVVQSRVPAPDFAKVVDPEAFNSFFEIPHLAARLRQKTSPELAELAYEALVRRDGLAPNARIEVFSDIAAEFRHLVEFPEALTFALTDERYVRNALQVAVSRGKLRAPVVAR